LKAITPPRKVRLRASFRLSCMKDLLEYNRHQRITAPVRDNRPLALALIPDEMYQSAYSGRTGFRFRGNEAAIPSQARRRAMAGDDTQVGFTCPSRGATWLRIAAISSAE
jgi:hypothetical protein